MIQTQTQTTIEDLLAKGFEYRDGGYYVYSYQKGELGCNLICCFPQVHWNLNIIVNGTVEYYFDRTKDLLSNPLSDDLTEKLFLLEQKYCRYQTLSDESTLFDIQSQLIEIIDTHEANNHK